jgi:hypothetical protein
MPAIGYSQASGKSLATNEYVISTHDFTGDGIPEILIAARDISGKGAHGNGLEMFVLQLKGDTWSSVGELGIFSANVSEFRIFRQAVTVKGQCQECPVHLGIFTRTDSTSKPAMAPPTRNPCCQLVPRVTDIR